MRTTRLTRLAVSIGLVAAGCSGGEEEEAPFESGSRLTARTVAFPGGSEILSGWYDAGLETACEFELAADGRYRCRPATALFEPVYSTDDCSDASALVAMTTTSCAEETPRFAISKEAVDDCSLGSGVYEIGESYSGSIYYRDPAGGCIAAEAPAGYSFRRAHELDPGEMVAAERTLEGDGRVRRYSFSAEDGAHEASPVFFDREVGEDCFFHPAADGEERCIPGDYFWYPRGAGVFGDPACSAPVQVLDRCKETDAAFTLDPTSCEVRLLAYELGGAVPSAYVGWAGQCVRVDDSLLAGHTARLLGDEIPPGELVAAALERRGDGRIQEEYARLEDGTRSLVGWWDTGRGERCRPLKMGDDAIHCVPLAAARADSSTYFGDEACRSNVPVGVVAEACADEDLAYGYEGECHELHLYDLAGPVNGPLFSASRDVETDACSPVGAEALARLRQVVGPVDLTQFEVGRE